jgi:hypothetical protein
MPNFTWDLQSSRYRDPDTGRFVPESVIRAEVDRIADASITRMVSAAKSLQTGQATIADFQTSIMTEIKTVNVAASMAAHGGRNAMAPADWLWTARDIKDQYSYARAWADDLKSGAAPLDDAVSTYENMRLRDARNSGAPVLVRNVLHAAEHCAGCMSAAGLGWVPLDQMPPLGSRTCKANDRCSLSYRAGAESEAA